MNTRPLRMLIGASLLAGCAYSTQPVGYTTVSYVPASPYYTAYSTYQPVQATSYQVYTYPAYPFYSPTFPDSGAVSGGGQ